MITHTRSIWFRQMPPQAVDYASVGENHALVPVGAAGQLFSLFAPPSALK